MAAMPSSAARVARLSGKRLKIDRAANTVPRIRAQFLPLRTLMATRAYSPALMAALVLGLVLYLQQVRALDKADQWIASHSPEQVADAIAPVAPGLDRELLVSAVKDTMVTAPKSTDISKTAYESSAKVLEESEIIQSVPPLDEPFSCDFADCTG